MHVQFEMSVKHTNENVEWGPFERGIEKEEQVK